MTAHGELETSLHLVQTPLYTGAKGFWRDSFTRAVQDVDAELSWDISAILSYLSFNYVLGDRTLLNEVTRRPWLSKIGSNGIPQLEAIPKHGRRWQSCKEISTFLVERLCDEAVRACSGHSEIYILLSGGLDSRIVSGVVAKARKEGRIEGSPVAVTWGAEDSRDVAYARRVAQILGFEWVHVPLEPDQILGNIRLAAEHLGCLISPVHLHCMGWFEKVAADSVVLAGSYGDSVGRAEFSGSHLLELKYLRPRDHFELIRTEFLTSASEQISQDLAALHCRSPEAPQYMICEYEMQGHYMRNMHMHTTSLINRYSKVYQMFTDPDVYQYMWSLHPSLRFDRIYAATLEALEPRLARLPWARTNRALKGRTEYVSRGLKKDFHRYEEWISGPLFLELEQMVDLDWYADCGFWNLDGIRKVIDRVRQRSISIGFNTYERLVWLAALPQMAQVLGREIRPDDRARHDSPVTLQMAPARGPSLAMRMFYMFRSIPLVSGLMEFIRRQRKRIRRAMLKIWFIYKYPPT